MNKRQVQGGTSLLVETITLLQAILESRVVACILFDREVDEVREISDLLVKFLQRDQRGSIDLLTKCHKESFPLSEAIERGVAINPGLESERARFKLTNTLDDLIKSEVISIHSELDIRIRLMIGRLESDPSGEQNPTIAEVVARAREKYRHLSPFN